MLSPQWLYIHSEQLEHLRDHTANIDDLSVDILSASDRDSIGVPHQEPQIEPSKYNDFGWDCAHCGDELSDVMMPKHLKKASVTTSSSWWSLPLTAFASSSHKIKQPVKGVDFLCNPDAIQVWTTWSSVHARESGDTSTSTSDSDDGSTTSDSSSD